MEFHESGVFVVAKASGHEVQAFFCPGPGINVHGSAYSPTSSACGVAIRMADGTNIVMMRSAKTKSVDTNLFTKKSAMTKGDSTIMDIYINGEKKLWTSLGPTNFEGEAVGSNVGEFQPGEAVSQNTFISKMHSKAGKFQGSVATAPTCVHDKDENFVIDVSVPIIQGRWPLVYEMSVTILASETDNVGLCGDQAMVDKIASGRKGYLEDALDQHRVTRESTTKSLFTSVQLAELYDTCDMNPETYTGNHGVVKSAFCTNKTQTTGYSEDDAETDCNTMLQGVSAEMRANWLDSCIIEQCATGGQATALVEAEEELQAWNAWNEQQR